MIEWMSQPWPWYVSGPLIAFVMVALLWVGGEFGVSSTLRTMCSIGGAGKVSEFFDFDFKSQFWNLAFIFGAFIGGFLAVQFFASSEPLALSAATISDMKDLGINFDGGYLPEEILSFQNAFSLQGIVIWLVGGFMVGFGTRWAGGCTSGHAISGLSNLQLPSLIAVMGFFAGGLLMTHVLFPLIFK